jgi:hypothetical protein
MEQHDDRPAALDQVVERCHVAIVAPRGQSSHP